MTLKHPEYAHGILDADLIKEAIEFCNEELDGYEGMEYDDDSEVCCQRSNTFIRELVRRLEAATPTPAPKAPTAKQGAPESAEEVKPVLTQVRYRVSGSDWTEWMSNGSILPTNFKGEKETRQLYTRPPSDAALLEEAMRALEPFAAEANKIGGGWGNERRMVTLSWSPALTVGNFRAARALLAKIGGNNVPD